MTKIEIAQILKQLRINAGLTQAQAASELGRKQQTLASWETGQSQPDANTLFTLCDIYGASVDEAFGFESKNIPLTLHESELITSFRQLNDEGQEKTVAYIDDLISSGKYIKNNSNGMGIDKKQA